VFSLYNLTDLRGIEPGHTDSAPHLLLKDLVNVIVGPLEVLLHERFARVRERAVTDIMEESGSDHEHAFFIGKPEPPGRNIGEEHSSEGVFEPRVIGTRVDEIGKSKLSDVAETLQRRGIEQWQQGILHFYVSVDRVLDDLHKFTKRIFIYIA
jgi:hypothetical protein